MFTIPPSYDCFFTSLKLVTSQKSKKSHVKAIKLAQSPSHDSVTNLYRIPSGVISMLF